MPPWHHVSGDGSIRRPGHYGSGSVSGSRKKISVDTHGFAIEAVEAPESSEAGFDLDADQVLVTVPPDDFGLPDDPPSRSPSTPLAIPPDWIAERSSVSSGPPSRRLHRGRSACPTLSANIDEIKWGGVETEYMLVSNPSSPKSKLTGRQKWLIAGLFLLQVPSSAIFYPLAAVFSLTGIGIPLSMILLGIGTMPFSLAMKRKVAWQSGGGSED